MTKDELQRLEHKIMDGYRISREEAELLINVDLSELSEAADRIRLHFCGNVCDVCSVAAVKVGQCGEDCLYCAQSTRAKEKVPAECVLGEQILTDIAVQDKSRGSYRYGLVSVGRRLSKREVALAVQNVEDIRKTADIHVCASLGMLDEEDFIKLHEAGMTMVHNNMEASDAFFKTLCTTHTSDDKRKSIRAAKKRQLRTVVLIENGRCAALDEIAAHNHDKIVRPGQFPGFCQLISMAVMKRIIFCNDCGNGHKTYLLSKKIARFQTERNRGSHSPIVTKTEKECKNSSVLDFLSSCFEFYTCERAKSVLQ